jgi:anti-sigma factor ChrR (cupin superfamily)
MLAQITQRFENLFDLAELDRRLLFQPMNVDGRVGVEIIPLYDTRDAEADGAAAAIVRYLPGAVVPRHVHGGYEFIFVLEGTLVNDTGAHRRGTLEVYPPGSSHRLESPEGCVFLVVWDKPVTRADAPLPEFELNRTTP